MAGTSADEEEMGAPSRRDFLTVMAASAGAVGIGAMLWPFVAALTPNADSDALAHPIVDVAAIPENTAITVTWAGLPIYIRKLTAKQIADAKAVVTSTLPDPADFIDRVNPGYENYVVVVGLNTGISCELEGNAPSESRGPFDGWLCPCDGSVYDPLGRVRGGPATKNLAIPRFTFLNDAQIRLG
ncbi:MAG TPA: ubiquinol-cytochrome c reductase iron-sulfur subunit [Acidocella sp.]|nr:ubiquinol-cytochrome c reductase iron-sulfur subunit [Acidocella sp.]